MTAPYGPGTMPGYPPQQPMYPAQPQQPPLVYAQQPGYAPAPAQPQWPQQQQPPQMPPQYQGADLNARLSGPGIPQELQGRTVAEGLRYYGVMREEFVRMRQAQQQQTPLQGQPQQPQQPQQQPQGGYIPPQSAQPRVPQQGAPGQPVDPMRQYITDGLREVLPEMLAPVTQPLQQRQMQEVYGQVRARYPDWQQFEGDIMQSLVGANAQQLSSPEVLEAAYFHAKGRAMSRPPQQGGQPGPGYQPNWPLPQQPQQPYPYQAPAIPYQGQAPAFVEGPTPPAPAQYSPNGQAADPRDELFAKRFNVPVEVYRSWKQPQGQSHQLGVLRTPQQTIPQQQGNGQPAQPNFGPPQYPGFPPQQFAPQPQYQPPVPPGWFQPSLTNGDGYGR